MIQVILTIILYPYLSKLWRYMSYLGVVFLVVYLIGYLIHTLFPMSRKQYVPKKLMSISIRKTLRPTKGLGIITDHGLMVGEDSSPAESNAAMAFKTIFRELFKHQFSTNVHSKGILKILQQPHSFQMRDGKPLTVLDMQLQELVNVLSGIIQALKSPAMLDAVFNDSLESLQKFLVLYKGFRMNYTASSSSESIDQSSHRHLDDFNEFGVESEDEALKKSVLLDKIHLHVLLSLKYANLIHPGVGNGKEGELAVMRKWFMQLLDLLEKNGLIKLSSGTMRVLIREWFVSTIFWPIIDRITQPDIINRYILNMANEKIMFYNTVNNFRSKLDQEFENFPPAFLIVNYKPSKLSMNDKLRYFEVIGGYLKKATSVIDVAAVKYEILHEIKRIASAVDELEQRNRHEDIDQLERYKKQAQAVLRKIEKRLKLLISANPEMPLKHLSRHPNARRTTASLTKMLNKFLELNEEAGSMNSPTLYYFLDFIEKKKDWPNTINLMRFWATAEKYRRLVWRIGSGIVAQGQRQTEKIEQFPPSSHQRLQKEVQAIFDTFVGPKVLPENRIKTNAGIMISFERYLAADVESLKPTFESDDYLCVVRLQDRVFLELRSIFNDFEHSLSYFQLSNQLEKERIIREQFKEDTLGSYKEAMDMIESSALIASLKRVLDESCIQLFYIGNMPLGSKFATVVSFFDDKSGIVTLDDAALDTNPFAEAEASKMEEDDDADMHAPGELFNHSTKLIEIGHSIERVTWEMACVKLLIQKETNKSAEFDGNETRQLNILEQTRDLLAEEIGELHQQKAKFESQEIKEALIPGQCFVTVQEIENITEKQLRPGRQEVYYLVTIEKKDLMTGWTVKRALSDFDELHQKLKEEFEMVNDFDLPTKSIGLFFKQKNDNHNTRSLQLQNYLQRLIDHRDISRSELVRNFLATTYKPNRKNKVFKIPFDFGADGNPNETLKRTQKKLAKKLQKFARKSFMEGKKRLQDEENSESDVDDRNWIPKDEYGRDYYSSSSSEDENGDNLDGSRINLTDGSHVPHPIKDSLVGIITNIFEFKHEHEWLNNNTALKLLSDHFKRDLSSSPSELINLLYSEEALIKLMYRCKEYLVQLDQSDKSVKNAQSQLSSRVEAKNKFMMAALSSIPTKVLGTEASYRGYQLIFEIIQNQDINKHVLFSLIEGVLQAAQKEYPST